MLKAALCRKVADAVAPETAGAGVSFIDGGLGALWPTQVRGVSRSVVDLVGARGVSLGPYQLSVAHLVPLLAAAAVDAQILLCSILFPFSAVSPRMATSPA